MGRKSETRRKNGKTVLNNTLNYAAFYYICPAMRIMVNGLLLFQSRGVVSIRVPYWNRLEMTKFLII